MSVILDALRRSEQQRQQGLMPTIFAMHDHVGRSRSFGKWLIVIALAANMTILGLYLWPGGAPAGLLMAARLVGHELGAPIPASRSGPAGYTGAKAPDAAPAGKGGKPKSRDVRQQASPNSGRAQFAAIEEEAEASASATAEGGASRARESRPGGLAPAPPLMDTPRADPAGKRVKANPSDLQSAAAQERADASAAAMIRDSIGVSHSRAEALAAAPARADTTRPVAPQFKPREHAGVPAATLDRSSPEHRPVPRPSKVGPSGSVLEVEELPNPRGPATSSYTERNRQASGGSLQAETLPMLWELPSSITRSMPELQFTMHVYSDDAMRRLVRVNGSKYQELDRIGSDLLLEEITEEGVVMNYKGTRFRVER